MKNELTYWLKENGYSFYGLDARPIICKEFVKGALGHTPEWIVLTISPFKRNGYTRAVLSPIVFTDYAIIGGNVHAICSKLDRDMQDAKMPSIVWFKIEEWK